MLNPDSSCRIYLCTGHTDMRKGQDKPPIGGSLKENTLDR